MSWYAQMMKSTEMARERNKREARRAQGDKYGPQFVAQYRMAVLDKEKKFIEKELERIRKGIHRTPRMENSVTNKDRIGEGGSTTRPLDHNLHKSAINPEYSKDENNLYDAILFLQNNPSALVPILSAHAQSDAYLETLERITPRLTSNSPPKPAFTPRYLKEAVSKTEKDDLLKKYTTLLHRHSPVLRRNSPLQRRTHRSSPVAHRDSPVPRKHTPVQGDSPLLQDGAINSASHHRTEEEARSVGTFLTEDGDYEQASPPVPPFSGTPRQKLHSLAKLADDGMSSTRDNISRRLSNTNANSTSTGAVNETLSSSREPPVSGRRVSNTGEDSDRITDENKPRPKAVVMFPSIDPEVYNPDGTLRTCLNMPSFDSAWKEAQKARYIRTRELLERDRELSVKEIFEKE